MSKPGMKRETASELLLALGFELYAHAQRTVIATALDELSDEAKADLIQYLRGTPNSETQCNVCGALNPLAPR